MLVFAGIVFAFLLGILLTALYCRYINNQSLKFKDKEKRTIEFSLKQYKSAKMADIDNEFQKKKDDIDNLTQFLENWKETQEKEKQSYLELLEREKQLAVKDLEAQYLEKTKSVENDIAAILSELNNWKSIDRTLYEERARRSESYDTRVLQLSNKSKEEITELMNISLKLSNATPLYKAIFEIYYKVPYKNLVTQQGASGICGIYKITNIDNGRIYIGQSVDIGNRWLQHLKRGVGCDVGTVSGSKLYSAIMEEKPWNFSFEVLEEVDKEQLTEREHYYIAFFNATETGYNMKG